MVDEEQAASLVGEEFGLLSAAEVARRAGSRGHSRTLAVRRWQQGRKVFAVPVAGLDHYPGFCFGADGRPRPVIGEVLATLDGKLSGWALAAWFVSTAPGLAARPVDLLDSDPSRVLAEARRAVGR